MLPIILKVRLRNEFLKKIKVAIHFPLCIFAVNEASRKSFGIILVYI